MKAFGFESGKKAFDDRVVVWIGFAAYGSSRATRVEKRLKLGAGVLNAAIGMMEQPGSEPLIEAGFFPRGDGDLALWPQITERWRAHWRLSIGQMPTFFRVIEFPPELQVTRLDLMQLFGRNAPLHVDLGCGDGSFLCEMGRQFPKKNFLGIERLTKRVEKVRRKTEEIENVRVLRADTLFAVRYLLPESSVETFYLLFPDPWPKRRHQFRRIFTRDFLDAIAVTLEKHGVLRVATDQLNYFHQIERLSCIHSCLEVADSHDLVLPLTKFERKFREQGASIYRLTLRKTSPVR